MRRRRTNWTFLRRRRRNVVKSQIVTSREIVDYILKSQNVTSSAQNFVKLLCFIMKV